jgi:hypothetical protein
MIDPLDFKSLPNYMDIVRAVAKARRDAWNAASRESSDIIDAEIFLASVQAVLLTYATPNKVSPLPESQPTTEPSSPPAEVAPDEPPLPPLEWAGGTLPPEEE